MISTSVAGVSNCHYERPLFGREESAFSAVPAESKSLDSRPTDPKRVGEKRRSLGMTIQGEAEVLGRDDKINSANS
jgi:hypothetical protein